MGGGCGMGGMGGGCGMGGCGMGGCGIGDGCGMGACGMGGCGMGGCGMNGCGGCGGCGMSGCDMGGCGMGGMGGCGMGGCGMGCGGCGMDAGCGMGGCDGGGKGADFGCKGGDPCGKGREVKCLGGSERRPPLIFEAGDWFEGVVADWQKRGFGFITLADNRRVYVHASSFGGGELKVGETVRCTLEEDDKNAGKLKANKLVRGPLGEEGVVKEWKKEGGFGFLDMEDGRRCYIHASVFKGTGKRELQNGMRLRVATKPDERNPGKWAVSEVKGGLEDDRAYAEGDDGLPPLLVAEVVEWDKRGFGFVQVQGDDRRIYTHHTSFGTGDLEIGEKVSITLGPDNKNPQKLMAITLVRDGGVGGELDASKVRSRPRQEFFGGDPLAALPEGDWPELVWSMGTVIEWNDERGIGHIEVEDGRRLHVHHSSFGGGSLQEGGGCEVVVAPDRKDPTRWMAAKVRGPCVKKREARRDAPSELGAEPAEKRQKFT